MSQPSQSVKAFVSDSYQLISSSSPSVPLHGDDMSKGIQFLNELLGSYSSTGLMLTISKQVDFVVSIGQGEITFGATDYVPTPDVTTEGRLANLDNAWVTLDGLTYPLIDYSRNRFFESYKYEPLLGLPRYIIVKPETNLTRVQIFPAPSQVYSLSVYGKFQLSPYDSTATMDNLPSYYVRYLRYALAKDLAMYKGRTEAWVPQLEAMLKQTELDLVAASSTNLDGMVNQESWLNGSWRVRSGI